MTQLDPDSNRPDSANGSLKAESVDPLCGILFEKRYVLESCLGRGATATAYRANDQLLSRLVVLKILHSSLLASPQAIQSFKNEAITGTVLSHANIARVYMLNVADDGRLYMLMDYFEGVNLADFLHREGKLNVQLFFELFQQIIDALAYAHENGVIHRDIKPSNILIVDEDGSKKPVLLDFGLARLISRAAEQGATLVEGQMGTSAYMSPEQCRGEANLDAPSDIYSLGCVFFETLIGNPPFQGESAMAVMYKHLNESTSQLHSLKELPEPLSKLIQKCLHKEKKLRFQNMIELKIEFDKCHKTLNTLGMQGHGSPKINRRTIVLPVAIVLILLVPLALIGKSYLSNNIGQKGGEKRVVDLTQPNSKQLEAAETIYIPRDLDQLDGLSLDYRQKLGSEAGSKASIILGQRWAEKYGAKVDPADLMSVYTNIAVNYCNLENPHKAEYYADKVLETEYAEVHAGLLAQNLSNLYLSKDPAKGVAILERLTNKYPRLWSGPERFTLCTNKAKCFEKMHDYQKAYQTLKLGSNFASKLAPDQQWQASNLREALILVLCKLGRKAELPAVIGEMQEAEENALAIDKTGLIDYFIGSALFEGQEYSSAIPYLEKARKNYLSSRDPAGSYRKTMVEELFVAHSKADDYDSAIKYGTELIKLCPQSELAKNYYGLSTVYGRGKKTLQRIAIMEAGLQAIKNIAQPEALDICNFQEELGACRKSA